MIGRPHRFGERMDGGPPLLEVTPMRSECDAGQFELGVGWEARGRREGTVWLDVGPWKLAASWCGLEVPFGWQEAAETLRQRCSAEANWTLRRRHRAWYTAKTLVCLALGRDEDDAPPREPFNDDYIEVAWLAGGSYASPGEPTTYWGDVLRVGRGVLRGWWTEIGYVST